MRRRVDEVILTGEERRLLAALADRAGQDDPGLEQSLTVGSRLTRLRAHRLTGGAAVLVLVAGAALMLATFSTQPILAVVGVALQAGALWTIVSRSGARCAAALERLLRDVKRRASQ